MKNALAEILFRPVGRIVTVALAVIVLIVILPMLHILPHFSNPFAQTTVQRNSSVVLKSITRLSRYEAASGSFQVLVDLKKSTGNLPAFLEGSDTLYVGQGSDIAYVNFSGLPAGDIQVSPDRAAVTVRLPQPQLEPAQLDLKDSHVFTQQEGLLTRIGTLFTGNSGSQQAVYIAAQSQLQSAARHSPLLAEARANTTAMLASLLHGLGFSHVSVTFTSQAGRN